MSARGPTACPHCDAPVPAQALACPSCGSDAATGWSDEAGDWAGALPAGYDDGDDGDDGDDDEFDYEDALRREGLLDDGVPSRRDAELRRAAYVVLVLVTAILLWLMR